MATGNSGDERPVIIKPVVDATEVRPGLQGVERAAADMAAKVGAEGRKAGDGLAGVGEGAKRGADTAERETGRMIASLQRAQAATEAGGRQTAAYYETLAKQRGLNLDTLRPYLDGLKQAEAAQKVATGSLDAMGMSAKQTAAALRGVPAQFTDIITSLQGGQAPLTVLLQQGGQLRDMFGSVGGAARALGGFVAGLITPTTLLAGAAAAVATGFVLGRREAQEYAAALVLSGNAAGTTTNQLADMARAIDGASFGVTQSKAAEVLTGIAASGRVAASSLQRYTQAAIDLERAGGPAAEETAKAFASLAREPLTASLRLTESMRYLTAATAEQIQQLELQGRTTEAARVAQEAYAQAIESRTPEMEARLGLLERAWRGITGATKEAGDALLDIGRPRTLQQQIDSVETQITRLRSLQGNAPNEAANRGVDRGLAALTAQRDALQEQVQLSARAAAAAGERARTEEAAVRWLKDGEKYLTSQQRLGLEVLAIRNQGLAAGKTEAEIAARTAAVVDKFMAGQKGDNGAKERERALEQQARLLSELAGVTGSYVQDLASLDDARRRGIVTEERYGELVRELVAQQPLVKKLAQEQTQAAQEQAAAVARAQQTYDRYIAGLDRSVDAGERNLQQLRLEFVELTAGKGVRQELELLEEERLATTYDQAAAVAELNGEEQARYQRLAEQVREEIRLRRGLMAGTAQNEAREANERAAKDAEREWERATDQIGQSLADALMQGGKSAWEYIVGLVRTQVLSPVIRFVAQPLIGGLASLTGLPALAGTAGGAAGAGAAGGPLSGIFSGLSMFSGALGAGATTLLNGGYGTLFNAIGAYGNAGMYGTAAGLGLGGLGAIGGGLLLGRGLGSAISGGYAVGGSGNSAINLGAALGAILGPLGSVLGGALGGAVNRLFGRKLADTGFEGTFGDEGDFEGNAFSFYKGGLFRSDKTKTGPLDEALAAVLDAGGSAVSATVARYVDILGLPAERIEGFTQKVRVSLKGLDEQEAQEAIAKVVAEYQETLLSQFRGLLDPLRREGETLAQVAERLSTLQVFSEGLNALGGVFSRVAGLSVDAREGLIALSGGMDVLAAQAQGFVQQYYSRDEIAGLKARELQDVFGSLGITQDVSTREQFRSLVEGANVGTEAGRERLAQLLAISGDFAQVADYLAEVGGSLADAAAQAPASSTLADIFAEPAQAQVDATDRVADGVDKVVDRLEKLIDAVQAARNVIVAPQVWEVGGA